MKASFEIGLTNQIYLLSQAIRKMFRVSWRNGVNQNPDHGIKLPKCVNAGGQSLLDDYLGVEREVDEHSNYLSWRKMNGDDPLESFLYVATRLGGAAWIRMMIEHHSLPYYNLTVSDLEAIKKHCEIEIAIKQEENKQNESSNSNS
jgi:hypothetical protein